jgi:hypothetical protein
MPNSSALAAALLVGAIGLGASSAVAENAAPQKPLHLQDIPWRSGEPKEIPDRVPEESGGDRGIRIRVGRIWRQQRQTHAAVNVRNVAAGDLHDVTIVCTAFDERNAALGSQQAELSPARYGPLKQGFTTDLDFVFDTDDARVHSLTCDAHARGLPRRVD